MEFHSSSRDIMPPDRESKLVITPPFPYYSRLKTVEQARGFELLRLAAFALHLRRLEQAYDSTGKPPYGEYEFRCGLLRHAIFQQVLVLIALDARKQAFQLIKACRTWLVNGLG